MSGCLGGRLSPGSLLPPDENALVVKAFESVLLESQIPEKLQTDEGKEFFNQSFQTLMKKHGIVHFATASDLKASAVERFNRTLKTRMWKYFTAHNTRHQMLIKCFITCMVPSPHVLK